VEIIGKREVHYKESLDQDKLNRGVEVVSGKMAIEDIKKLPPVFERVGVSGLHTSLVQWPMERLPLYVVYEGLEAMCDFDGKFACQSLLFMV